MLSLDNFHKNITRKDGHRGECKRCSTQEGKKYRAKNLDKVRAKGRENARKYRENNPGKAAQWYKETIEARREYSRKRRRKYPLKHAEIGRKFYRKHQEKRLKAKKIYVENNKEKIKLYIINNYEKIKAWKEKNPEKIKEYIKRGNAKRINTTKGKLNARMGNMIWRALKGAKEGKSWKILVPYSLEQLRKHIEKQFTEGMSWDAFMRGEIHIDHIIPVSVFVFNGPEDIQFQACWALKNLRPLWAEDNHKKRNTLLEPFQQYLL